jgi:hypothetical protein
MSTDNLLIRNIYIFCLMHAGNQTDTEKLARDVIASAIRSGQFPPARPPANDGIVFECIFPALLQNIDLFRQTHRDFLNVESPTTLFSSSLEHDWLPGIESPWETFFQTFQYLPQRQQIVIMMRLFCSIDRFTIAHILAITPREVTSILIKGLQELRYRLEDPSADIPNNLLLSDDQIDAFDSFLADQDSDHGDLWIEEAALAGSILQLAKAIRIDPIFQNELTNKLESRSQKSGKQTAPASANQTSRRGWIFIGCIAALIFIVGIAVLWARQNLKPSSVSDTVTQVALPPTKSAETNAQPETIGRSEITQAITENSISSTGAPLSDLPSSAQITLDTTLPSAPGSLASVSISSTSISDELIQSYRGKFANDAQIYRLHSGSDQTAKFLLVSGGKWILITPSSRWLTTNSIGAALEVTDQTISHIHSDQIPIDWTVPAEQDDIRSLAYQPGWVTPLAGRPLRTAENAWEAVQKRDESAWIRFADNKTRWPGVSWEKTYQSGDNYDIYSKIEVYDPVSSGSSTLILLNSLFVEGDPGDFRSQAQTGQLIHAWGTVKEADSDHPATLVLKGFEGSPLPYTEISGRIIREKDNVRLSANDGTIYHLTDVPSEVPDGLACTLSGVIMGSTQKEFNWIRIVSNPDPTIPSENIPQVWFSEHSLSIDRVRLVYSSGGSSSESQTTAETVVMNPFWEFSGHSSDGNLFTILISAFQE